jgi:hypothetical protein
MYGKSLAVSVLAAAVILFASAAARAGDDVLTLKMGAVSAPTMTLGFDGKDADSIEVARGFHHGFHGGFHNSGFHHGFHGGFHHSHFHHGFGFAFYPRYYYPSYYYPGFGFGLNFYRPYYYAPPLYDYSTPYYYNTPYYYTPSYYSPIGVSLTTMPYAVSLSIGRSPAVLQTQPAPAAAPLPGSPPLNGTFPYDGGPANPVPMPRAEPAPTSTPPATVPLEGRVVSLPAKPAKLTYPAYGEQPITRNGPKDGSLVTKGDSDKKPSR